MRIKRRTNEKKRFKRNKVFPFGVELFDVKLKKQKQ